MARTLAGSVGMNGRNLYDDVSAVQLLLNNVSELFTDEGGPSPQIDLDGVDGPDTHSAIKTFQLRHFGKADSRVDPLQRTIDKLNGFDLLNVRTPVEEAERVKPLAQLWVQNALTACDSFLAAGADPAAAGTAAEALRKHFKIDTLPAPGVRQLVVQVRGHFAKIQTTLAQSKKAFRNMGDKTARRLDREINKGTGDIGAAWTTTGVQMGFTSEFKKRGDNCKRAMIVHEAAHYVSSTIDDNAAEWDEPAYANLSAQSSLHNASSYPTFAVHVTTGSDTPASRFGEGNPGI